MPQPIHLSHLGIPNAAVTSSVSMYSVISALLEHQPRSAARVQRGLGRRTGIKRRYDKFIGSLARWTIWLFKCEGSFAYALLAQVFKPFLCLGYSWNMSCFYPPERHVYSFKFLKPLPTTTHYLCMCALVRIRFEVIYRLPNRKIYYYSVIIIRTNPSSVTLFSLKPPNKSRASIRKGVNLTKRCHELGHNGIIKWRQHSCNIYLGNVIYQTLSFDFLSILIFSTLDTSTANWRMSTAVCSRHSILQINLKLQFLNVIQNEDKSFPQFCQIILHTWWNLRIRHPFQ